MIMARAIKPKIMAPMMNFNITGYYEPHTWDTFEIIKPSSCTEEGTIRYTCKCGATKEEAIPMHSFAAEWTSDNDRQP